MEQIDITKLSTEEQDRLFQELQTKKKSEHAANREAYEALKADFVNGTMCRVAIQKEKIDGFYDFLLKEVDGFRQVMAEYGAISTKQMSFKVADNDFKIEVKTNKVKKFDERADMAAQRLITFLKEWIKEQKEGTENPMYQLAMMSIERNAKGDLDYKQVSNLYKLETSFSHPEYTAIMGLFRESHIIEGTATNYYFYKKDENQVWRKIEISFNRL